MLTQLKQFYYFYETEVIHNVKIKDAKTDIVADSDSLLSVEID